MSDTIFTNKYFVIALMIAFIILLYLYSQTRSCTIENAKNSNSREKFTKFTKVNNPLMEKTDSPAKTQADNKIVMNDDDNFYTLMEFGGDNYGRGNKRKSIINGIPQPLDMRPDLSQCQPCINNAKNIFDNKN